MKIFQIMAAIGLAASSLTIGSAAQAHDEHRTSIQHQRAYSEARGHRLHNRHMREVRREHIRNVRANRYDQRHDRWERHDRGRHTGWERGRHHGWSQHAGRNHCWTEWRHHHRVRVCR
jgi:hypothetical protein